jgi:orotate phosphoribosyltransferase-like protein
MLRQRARELHTQGWTYPEIAQELGISVGGAWNLVNKDEGGV